MRNCCAPWPKPDIIWCAITGFGQTGPGSDRIGYDFLIQAMGGIMSITGEPVWLLGNPRNLSATPVQYRSPPPHLDADREAALHLLDKQDE